MIHLVLFKKGIQLNKNVCHTCRDVQLTYGQLESDTVKLMCVMCVSACAGMKHQDSVISMISSYASCDSEIDTAECCMLI